MNSEDQEVIMTRKIVPPDDTHVVHPSTYHQTDECHGLFQGTRFYRKCTSVFLQIPRLVSSVRVIHWTEAHLAHANKKLNLFQV